LIPPDQLQLGEKIGQGSFGAVYKGKWKGTLVACKCAQAVQSIEFLKEAELMINLRPHPNVVQILGLCADHKRTIIVLEYLACGTLEEYLRRNAPLKALDVINFAKGVALGMLHLHSEKVVHRDLAARNILLSKGLDPKVSDFGFSRVLQEDAEASKTMSVVGPLRWMAPESIANRVYSNKSDVWSFGVLSWEIQTGKKPHADRDLLDVGLEIKLKGLHPEIPDDAPDVLKEIMTGCFKLDPKDRPEFSDICDKLDHVYLREREKSQ